MMNIAKKVEVEGVQLLRVPFEPHHISKLPKPTKAQTDAVKADFKAGIRCEICKGWHHPKVEHLDYVGHAALTDRLLDADIKWSWEPLSFDERGLPARDQNGGLWIKLTVDGVTRLGYGSADGKTGGDAVKEIIGDALRNAAMRFGAALDLWHKGELHPDMPEDAANNTSSEEMPDHEWARLVQLVQATSANIPAMLKHLSIVIADNNLKLLDQEQYGRVLEALNAKLAKMAKDETNAKATNFGKELADEIVF